MSTRRLAALLTVLASIPVLAGCGAADTLSPEAVAKAADATAAKGGMKLDITQTLDVPGAGHISQTGHGVMDTRAQRGRVSLTTSGAPGGANLTQDLVIDHFVMYMRSPVFAAALKHGKTWVKLDLARFGKAAGIDFSAVTQLGQDPTQAVRLLKAVSGDITKVGEEDVRGVKTTHFKATVDFRKYAELAPAKDRATIRASMEKIIALSGTSTVPVEVWLGDDNVVRRLHQKLRFKVRGQSIPIDQTIELYDFGTNVDASPPPAGEVQDLTDVAASGARRLAP